MAKNRNKKKRNGVASMDCDEGTVPELHQAMDISETGVQKPGSATPSMKRSKNVRKAKAVGKAIAKNEKYAEKSSKIENKKSRIQSAKVLYDSKMFGNAEFLSYSGSSSDSFIQLFNISLSRDDNVALDRSIILKEKKKQQSKASPLCFLIQYCSSNEMASSSSMSMRCFHCKVSSDTFIPGWRLRNGGFAMLCLRCGLHMPTVGNQDELEIQLPKNVTGGSTISCASFIRYLCYNKLCSPTALVTALLFPFGGVNLSYLTYIYAFNDGTLCETFHPEESGWRECVSCKKVRWKFLSVLHFLFPENSLWMYYGSPYLYNIGLYWRAMYGAPHRCSLHLGRPEAFLQATDSPQIPSADPEKMITGVNPISPPDCLVRNAPPKMVANPTTPGHQSQSPPAETEEEDSVNSPGETKTLIGIMVASVVKVAINDYVIAVLYDIRSGLTFITVSKSSLVPLFEKELTFSDAESRNGRLLLPKRCAEAYFPKTSGQQGIFLMLQDTNGNAWKLHFRYWTNNCGKMYVLEGLRDYKIQMKWEAGDTVRFYKREADGQLVMGFKKNQAPVVVVKSPTDA
ncbi:B3 domain-containing protein [Hibiscus syriacus]|uniref:B3 domain-containing protein n=1 Tax=Hibiscus syriacus TaxID=106335 RepID=A0A6A2YP66_HIBSY|nr:B3 domain-containing protein [Hibiscus syriacus]